MFKKSIVILSILFWNIHSYAQGEKNLPPVGLMCDLIGSTNYQSINGYPINASQGNLLDKNIQSVLIESKKPAFSWELRDDNNNTTQTAYQLLVSDNLALLNNNTGNIWNSGKVASVLSASVLYDGSALKPNSTYYWKIRIWNNHQEISPYSSPIAFYTGMILKDYKTPAYPIQITEENPLLFKPGKVHFVDFGRDAFAQLRLQLFSKNEGDTIVVHIGEALNANGNIDRKPKGNVRYGQYFLTLHKGLYTYQLKIKKDAFNTRSAAMKMPDYIGEVTPFRYCEIEGYNYPLKENDLTRLSVHYKFDDNASSFHSSDSTLNAVWDLCKYSIKATSYLGIYVDGDRERIPYEADAYINQLSHYAVDKEFTLARNSHEYLIEHPTWPTEWILQSVLIAWNDYLYTGDIRSAKYYFEDLKAKSLVSLEDSTHLISTLNGKLTEDVKSAIHHEGDLKDIVDWPHGSETDDFVFTKYNAVVNAFYYKSLMLMEKLANGLGKTADADMYKQKAIVVKKAYQEMFFDKKRYIYVDGIGTQHASLHANAFALALGLVDAKHQNNVLNFIKSRGMACSVYASQFLLDGVFDAGDGQYGLSLLRQKTDRSWFNMLKVGSTITLEAWDNKYKPNQDWNHAWGAAPANIITRKLMGIEPITPGWTSFSVKPQIGDITNASIDVPTIKGPIKVAYEQTSDSFLINIDIPSNTLAQIYLPLKTAKKYQVWLDNQQVKAYKMKQTALISNIGSGKHELKIVYIE